MDARTKFHGLCLSGFPAKASCALARTPVLALSAGDFFKMPAGVISDIIGRRRTMLFGLALPPDDSGRTIT